MAQKRRTTRDDGRLTLAFSPHRVALFGCVVALAVGMADAPMAWAKPKAGPKWLEYSEAQRFVLGLINRDRKQAGLSPVVLDAAASKAGCARRDMAGMVHLPRHDGSTRSSVSEVGQPSFKNTQRACRILGAPLDEKHASTAKLAALHQMFMAEVPPNDGHRRNVLKPLHNRVGIGLAQPATVAQPCLAQEFVDDYGEYEPLPRELPATLRVAGSVSAPLVFGGVGIGRTPLPKPLPRERLNGSRYRIPAPDTVYFPAGFKTPKPVKVSGRQFSIDLDLGPKPPAGSYAVTICAKTRARPSCLSACDFCRR